MPGDPLQALEPRPGPPLPPRGRPARAGAPLRVDLPAVQQYSLQPVLAFLDGATLRDMCWRLLRVMLHAIRIGDDAWERVLSRGGHNRDFKESMEYLGASIEWGGQQGSVAKAKEMPILL